MWNLWTMASCYLQQLHHHCIDCGCGHLAIVLCAASLSGKLFAGSIGSF